MQLDFRPAKPEDFDFCAKLYYAGREQAIREENLDMNVLLDDLRRRWEVAQVQIISLGDEAVGWRQIALKDDSLFLVQLFIRSEFQGKGIGTQVMHRIIDEGRAIEKAITLGVVKTNPALRLYTRLGFLITHEDERKYYMRLDLTLE